MKKRKSFKGGFTLIELLVVIAIIGILTTIVSANLAASKSKARDAKRISDIAQIQLGLEFLFDKCSSYPATGPGYLTISSSCGGRTLGDFITVPTDSGTAYGYVNTGSDYLLRASLENYNNVLIDDINGNFGTVSNGCNNNYYCVSSK